MITEKEKSSLVTHLDSTELGYVRISKNLNLIEYTNSQIKEYLRGQIEKTPLNDFLIKGKNYYINIHQLDCVITVNRSSLGIITAHKK